MTESVKPRRRYESRRRAAQAEQTRHDIVIAAGVMFRERGYAVPLAEIAGEAGVVVETVYRIFGTKAALFTATIDALLAGGAGRADVPVGERPAIRAIRAEADPRRQVAAYAATQPGIHRRAGPLLRALRDARASEPELGRLWDEIEASRLDGQGRFVRMLADHGALKEGLGVDAGIDILWTLCSLAVYDMLVVGRGWAVERYLVWLTDALTRELLPPASRSAHQGSLWREVERPAGDR
jgi:AcrR family transcriptional regulator